MPWPRTLERFEVLLVRQREAYVVEAFHDAPAGEVVHLESLVDVGGGDGELVQFDGDHGLRIFPDGLKKVLDGLLGQVDSEKAVLGRVVLEDVCEGRGDHRAEAMVLYRPDRVLAAGTGAEVLARDKYHGVFVLVPVHYEVFVLAPAGEQELTETGALDALESVARDDLVRVHIRVTEGKRRPRDALDRLH